MLDPLYNLVARGVIVFHNILSPIFGKHSFFSYAIAIAFIVIIVRIVIFPLFVRSVRAQRTMQMLQPRIKEIREKYKNDKQRMNQEVMKLQKEHGNPLLGCLPLLLQIPLFIALYHVFNAVSRAPTVIKGTEFLQFKATSGLTGGVYDPIHHILGTYDAAQHVVVSNSSQAEVAGLATAKVGGITLSSALTTSKDTLKLLGANGTTVKIVAAVMIVIMAITVYITQRQIISRGGPVDPQQQKIQRLMLYGSPLALTVFGFRFPIAVLVYWLTTNTWSMGQQFFILRKMPPVLPGTTGAGTATSGRAAAAAPAKGKLRKGAPPEPAPSAPKLTQIRQTPADRAPKPADPEVTGDADQVDLTKDSPPSTDNGSAPAKPTKAGSGAGSGKGGGTGRSVSGGQANRPKRNNRPAAKPRGKGPRKGGRR